MLYGETRGPAWWTPLSSQPDETGEEYSKNRVAANLYSLSEAHDVALERNLGSAAQEGHVSTCGVPYGHVHLAIADDDGCVLAESESEGWLHIAGRRGCQRVPRTARLGGDATRVRVEDVARRCDADVVRHGGSREGSEGWTVGPPRPGAGAGRVKIRGKLVRLFFSHFRVGLSDLTDDVFNTHRLTSMEWRRSFVGLPRGQSLRVRGAAVVAPRELR